MPSTLSFEREEEVRRAIAMTWLGACLEHLEAKKHSRFLFIRKHSYKNVANLAFGVPLVVQKLSSSLDLQMARIQCTSARDIPQNVQALNPVFERTIILSFHEEFSQ